MTREEKQTLKLKELQGFAMSIDAFMDGQPPGDDLDACSDFLRELHSLFATVSQKSGEAETLFNMRVMQVISDTNPETEEAIKKVKNSSTLTVAYVAGKYPNEYSIWQRLNGYLQLFKLTSDDYRTLISAYKSQKELEMSGIKQTAS